MFLIRPACQLTSTNAAYLYILRSTNRHSYGTEVVCWQCIPFNCLFPGISSEGIALAGLLGFADLHKIRTLKTAGNSKHI